MRCPGCGYTANHDRATACKLCGAELKSGGGGRHAPARPEAPAPAAEEASGPARGSKAPARAEWTRHMLVRAGGSPMNLEPEKPFCFGRATECEVSIPSSRVSRRHAEIFWKDGKAWIRDLGSQNGTQVNGRPVVGEHQLLDQEEIVVGPFTCTYRAVSGVGSVGLGQKVDMNAPTLANLSDALSGNLSNVGVTELLDSLEWSKKSGTLEVFHPDGEEALLVIQDGAPHHAALGGQTGKAAVHTLLGWTEGLFRFGPEIDPAKPQNLRGETLAGLIASRRR